MRRGVAILVHKRVSKNVTALNSDRKGRILQVEIHVENEEPINLVTVYAPNHTHDRIKFFESLGNYMSTVNANIIVGDYNCVLNTHLDIAKHMYMKDASRKRLHELINEFNL